MSDKHVHREPPPRWRDCAAGTDDALDRASALIRGALVPGDPSNAWTELVRQRIRQGRRWSAFSPRRLRLAVAAAVFLTGASVAAYEVARHEGWLGGARPERERPAPVKLGFPRRSIVAKQASNYLTDDKLRAPGSEAEEVRGAGLEPNNPENTRDLAAHAGARRAMPRSASSSRDESKGVPAAPAASDEIQTLEHAIGLLRKDRDASGALAELDAYLGRYPGGALAREARVARVDALLMLKRLEEALVALEALPLDAHGRSTELQVVRGELRARSSCSLAEEDFSAVLGRTSDKNLLERARYGRASCRARRGDTEGAAADVESYLDRFPAGAHAAWARGWLDSVGRP